MAAGNAGIRREMKYRESLPRSADGTDMWVFGYGSLMWNPELPHSDCRDARLWGFHRGLCIYSHTYRGTPEKPGLVFGLDRGGSCKGRALRVSARDIDPVIDYLYEREMVNNVYRAIMGQIEIDGIGRERALVFVADETNLQYCGKISDAEAARLIKQGVGPKGTSYDYVRNTLEHLRELGIRDRALERIVRLADTLKTAS